MNRSRVTSVLLGIVALALVGSAMARVAAQSDGETPTFEPISVATPSPSSSAEPTPSPTPDSRYRQVNPAPRDIDDDWDDDDDDDDWDDDWDDDDDD
ncbi:hypothetical protein [Aeromicrobium sp. CTD01-1L150]|uniref:hypothetical protein n=1 Tax=Aeromicrobium sp. CTD01-1L150 TaxID=3341830 RepID=UPI0035C14DD7